MIRNFSYIENFNICGVDFGCEVNGFKYNLYQIVVYIEIDRCLVYKLCFSYWKFILDYENIKVGFLN